MTAFALERGGAVLTSAELQAMSGGRDAGVIDNVSVVRKEGPASLAMAVGLPKGSASPHRASGTKGGMSFPWEPRALSGKASACLAYHVFFPADFDFGRGGRLPGLGGAEPGEHGDGFVASLVWRPNGGGSAGVRVNKGGNSQTTIQERSDFTYPRGRWVRLEQEVVLNAPNASDGVLRVWVDGVLTVERTDATYRSKAGVTLSSVMADAHYSGGDAAGSAPKDTKLWLSPFEIRWQ
jgi:hypothetical protein